MKSRFLTDVDDDPSYEAVVDGWLARRPALSEDALRELHRPHFVDAMVREFPAQEDTMRAQGADRRNPLRELRGKRASRQHDTDKFVKAAALDPPPGLAGMLEGDNLLSKEEAAEAASVLVMLFKEQPVREALARSETKLLFVAAWVCGRKGDALGWRLKAMNTLGVAMGADVGAPTAPAPAPPPACGGRVAAAVRDREGQGRRTP